jgi:hypothetical protein
MRNQYTLDFRGSRLSASRWGVRLSLSARVCFGGRESSFCTQSISLVCHSRLSSSQRCSDHSAPSHKCVLVTVFSWVGHRAFQCDHGYSVPTLIRGLTKRRMANRPQVQVKSGIAALREERARVQAFAFGLFSSTKMLEALRARVSQVRTYCL